MWDDRTIQDGERAAQSEANVEVVILGDDEPVVEAVDCDQVDAPARAARDPTDGVPAQETRKVVDEPRVIRSVAAFATLVVGGDEDRLRELPECRNDGLDVIGKPALIRVEERDDLTAGPGEGSVPRGGRSAVRRSQNDDAGPVLPLQRVGCPVRRAIVDDDHLELRERLGESALDRFANELSPIVRRDDRRDERGHAGFHRCHPTRKYCDERCRPVRRVRSRPGMLVATHSGLRGRPGIELTDAVVARTICGLVDVLASRGLPLTIAVARDARPASTRLASTAADAAIRHGADVVDLGVVSTPGAKLAARRRGLGGCVVVTGSHLGPGWSGLKPIIAPLYGPLDVRLLPEPSRGRSRPGALDPDGGAPAEHAEAIAGAIDVEVIREAGLGVSCSGGAGPAADLLLERLGCRRAGRADVGLLLDADGDRLQLVSEAGETLEPELVLPLVAFARKPQRVVKGADTSSSVDAVVARWRGVVHVVPPGELHLVEEVVSTDAQLAGEGNGGVMIPAVGVARDALAAAASILELVARTRRPLSELAAAIPTYAVRRSVVACTGDDEASALLTSAAARLGVSAAEPRVGLRVGGGNGSWGLVRQSGTEPVLRVTAEASSDAEADALHGELLAALGGA